VLAERTADGSARRGHGRKPAAPRAGQFVLVFVFALVYRRAVPVRSLALLLVLIAGCGPSLPARFVLERDVGHLSYRRYQRVLDVEFPVAGNSAVGHTATYVYRSDHGEPPYVNVFVTVYTNAPGLAADVRRQVQSLTSYEVSVEDVGGGRGWVLDGGPGDRWIVWVSGSHVVKVGGTTDAERTREMVSAYMSMYPSDLDEHGRARPGTTSAGDATGEVTVETEELEMPHSLEGEEEAAGPTPESQ
jgi:hypothetical protein